MEQRNWTEIIKDAIRIETVIPEFEAGLVPLIRDLRFVEESSGTGLGRLSTDLDNLMSTARDTAALRGAGIGDEGVNDAVRALSSLVTDMRHRTSKLIKAKVEEVKVNAVVAAHRVQTHDGPPEDVTREFRTLHAHPATEDKSATQSVINTGYDSDVEMGVVSGEVLIAAPKEQANTAPIGAVILPKGKSLTLQKGDVITLHTHGYGFENDLINERQNKSVMIEITSEQAVLSGPLLFSPSSLPNKTLSVLKEGTNLIEKIIEAENTRVGLFLLSGFVSYPIAMVISIISFLINEKSFLDLPIIFAMIFFPLIFWAHKKQNKKIKQLTKNGFSRKIFSQLKVAASNNAIDSLVKRFGEAMCEAFDSGTLNVAKMREIPLHNVRAAQCIYALPARFTKIDNETPLRVLESLVAIEDKREVSVIEKQTQGVNVMH